MMTFFEHAVLVLALAFAVKQVTIIILYGSIFVSVRDYIVRKGNKTIQQLFSCYLCLSTQLSIWTSLLVVCIEWQGCYLGDASIFFFILLWILYSFAVSGLATTIIELTWNRNKLLSEKNEIIKSTKEGW